MKILHLNQSSSSQGGVESYIQDVSRQLQRYGHQSHLVSFTPGESADICETASYVPLPDWPGAVDEAVAAIEAIITEQHADVLYLHAVYHPALINRLAQAWPSVAYIHGPYPVCPGSAQYLRQSARVCPQAAGISCLIQAQREKCCWGRNPAKHWQLLQRTRQFAAAHRHVQRLLVGSHYMQQLLVRSGIAVEKTSQLAPVLIDPANIPEPSQGDTHTILFAGRLTSEKGLAQLIHALSTIPALWQLRVAGDGPERETCQSLARQLGVADRVQFLGWQNPDQITQLYRQCAMVAVPSLWPEPFGRIGPEAFVQGRPVVAYATGGVPDWLDDGETGFLVSPGNVPQLAQRLQQLLVEPELGHQLGEQARQRAATRWNFTQHIEQLLHTFNAAITHQQNRKEQN